MIDIPAFQKSGLSRSVIYTKSIHEAEDWIDAVLPVPEDIHIRAFNNVIFLTNNIETSSERRL